MKPWAPSLCLAFACLLAAPATTARESPDPLSACLLSSAGDDDRRTLVQWMFAAIAVHPDLQGMAAVSDAQRNQASAGMGGLIERLLTVDCVEQARAAMAGGQGEAAFNRAFGLLGQVAGENLFAEPRVAAAAAEVAGHIDMNRLADEIVQP